MRAPGAVQVLRSAQAARQSRRPGPPSGHVRLHSASCCAQRLWHAAAALTRVAASDRPTLTTRKNSTRRRDRYHTLLRPSAGCQRCGGRARPATAGCRRPTADRGPQAMGRGPRAPSAPSASFAAPRARKIGRTKGVFALGAYQPSARRVYHAAALSERTNRPGRPDSAQPECDVCNCLSRDRLCS